MPGKLPIDRARSATLSPRRLESEKRTLSAKQAALRRKATQFDDAARSDMGRVRIKRAYDPPARGDGYRVLIDRLWPRGRSKDALQLDAWLKELAPSADLRRWFGHAPARWVEFRRRYRRELQSDEAQSALEDLARIARRRNVTLVYGAQDTEHNDAVVLQSVLNERLGS